VLGCYILGRYNGTVYWREHWRVVDEDRMICSYVGLGIMGIVGKHVG